MKPSILSNAPLIPRISCLCLNIFILVHAVICKQSWPSTMDQIGNFCFWTASVTTWTLTSKYSPKFYYFFFICMSDLKMESCFNVWGLTKMHLKPFMQTKNFFLHELFKLLMTADCCQIQRTITNWKLQGSKLFWTNVLKRVFWRMWTTSVKIRH